MPILNLFQPPRALAVGKTPIHVVAEPYIALTMSTYFAYIQYIHIHIQTYISLSAPLVQKLQTRF